MYLIFISKLSGTEFLCLFVCLTLFNLRTEYCLKLCSPISTLVPFCGVVRKYFSSLGKDNCYSQLLLVDRMYTFSKTALQFITMISSPIAHHCIQILYYIFYLKLELYIFLLRYLSINCVLSLQKFVNISLLLMILFLILI